MEAKQFIKHLTGVGMGVMLLMGDMPSSSATAAHTVPKLYDVQQFVFTRVEKALPREWKRSAPAIARTIMAEARLREFDPLFLMAVIQTESGFRPGIRGGAGEIGLMQIKPSTAQWMAEKYGIKWRGPKTLKDPTQNIRIGAAYLSNLRERFDDHGGITYLAAYNIGAAKLRSMIRNQVTPVQYTMRVSGHYVGFFTEYGKEVRTRRPAALFAKR